MTKWKDTARATCDIVKKPLMGETIIIPEGTLLVVAKELPNDKYLVSNTDPNSVIRRHFSLKKEDVVLEDYGITRDLNIPMLLMDGWDAKDLLRDR